MVDTTMDALAWVRKQVEQADTDLLREMVKGLLRAGDVRGACSPPPQQRAGPP